MKTKLDEISARLEKWKTEGPVRDLLDILKDLVEEVKRVDQKYQSRTDDLDSRQKRTDNTASCLANGILPD